MIKRIESINGFGVYHKFEWAENLKRSNRIVDFSKLNIIYGRNYSGKTTLSRIVRSMELKKLHEDYGKARFSVCFDGGLVVSEEKIAEVNSSIRVFNKDFVKDNLEILLNDDGEISTFAILGEENVEVEKKINSVKAKLGSVEEESGQLYKLHIKESDQAAKKKTYDQLARRLEDKLKNKAKTIKNDRDLDAVNYNIKSIKDEIAIVVSKDYKSPDEKSVVKSREAIKEVKKDDVLEVDQVVFNLEKLMTEALSVIAEEIKASVTIEDLSNDKNLQAWVKQGISLNNDREKCAFCDSKLTDQAWERLKNHFNKESEELTKKITQQKKTVELAIGKLDNIVLPALNTFYSEFSDKHNDLEKRVNTEKGKIKAFLNNLKSFLDKKEEDVFKVVTAEETFELHVLSMDSLVEEFNKLVKINNESGSKLEENKNKAHELLRKIEVKKFIDEINYSVEVANVSQAKLDYNDSKEDFEKERTVKEKLENELREHESELKDESKGAEKINKYLSDFFGHNSLRLEHIEGDGVGSFQIRRGEEEAKNLSEGESSLIAFCYFMAKLHDLNTKKEETIIWIDDPISSLDSNHIFFIFSLIENELTSPTDTGNGNKYNYAQLFLSTHNLEFMKFLKRLSTPFEKVDKKKNELIEYFMIERGHKNSVIKLMPRHLSFYVTEFNYLFEKIKACADGDISSPNYDVFYNFGNNLRKFLESYLFYRYPSKEDAKLKAERFFGDDKVAKVLVERISNEMSHSEGQVEKGTLAVDIPETVKVAKFVLEKIKEKDPEQYDAFLRAI